MKIDKCLENRYVRLSIFVLVSFLVLLIGSACSFLYKFNDWPDVNYFIVLGKGVLDGKVMYKDLFEQKGPILYFVFAFIALFKNPYYATFIFECITMTIFALIAYKIARRYTNTNKAVLSVILLIVITVSLEAFNKGGGAVEEYLLPILAYFIYLFLQIVEDNKGLTKFQAILSGFLFGVIFWVKYTVCFMPAVVYIIWFIKNVKEKKAKDTIITILMVLSGFALNSLLVFSYFIYHGAVREMLYYYLYVNLFKYSGKINLLYSIGNLIGSNFLILPIIICGYVICKKTYKWKKQDFVYSIVLLSLTVLQLIFTVGFRYYFLQLAVFMIMPIVMIVDWLSKKKLFNLTSKKRGWVTAISCLLVVLFMFVFTNSNMLWGTRDEDYPQIQIAKKIREINPTNPTLYCYNFMDGGFYQQAGIVPSEKFFAFFNFKEEKFPEMFDSMRASITEKRCEFVIVKKDDYEKEQALFDGNYFILEEYEYKYHNSKYILERETYILLQRI